MDASHKPINSESLGMAKKRDKKVYITDIAINKVPLVQYNGFTDNQNQLMQKLAQEVLTVSKEQNDSNEVAITCDLGADNPLEVYGVSFGTEHEVDVRADTLSNHILVSQKTVAVVVLHNHPSTQTFSIQDIRFFIEFSVLEVMVVVSNQGTIHYLRREENYNLKKAAALFNECVENLEKDSPLTEVYLASLSFLAKSSEAGIYYR
jgi:proteasome lid subunit RPN8/RPN11